MLKLALVPALVVAAAIAVSPQAAPGTMPLFAFHSNAWLNLHHFIRAQARGGPAATELSDEERLVWAAGVEFYKRYASRDVLNDDGMVSIKNALRAAGGDTLTGIAIDADLRQTLDRVMPVYRRRWWPDHDRANRAWIESVEPMVARHGRSLAAALAAAYETPWPAEPIPVDLSVIAGPVGAYTTTNPTHVMISSQDPGYRGYAALEMLFHESSHGVSGLYQRVSSAARTQAVSVPPGLWHGVLFYTAGELTRRELAASGVDYTDNAGAEIYKNLCGEGCRGKIADHWTRQLGDGRPGADAALSALVASLK